MKVNLEMNTPVHAADELPHQALLFLRVFVVDGVELPQKLSRAADHAEKVGILPADEGNASEALFVFRGHDSSLFRKRRRAIDEVPGVFFPHGPVYKRGGSDRQKGISLFRMHVMFPCEGGETGCFAFVPPIWLGRFVPPTFFRFFDTHQVCTRRASGVWKWKG